MITAEPNPNKKKVKNDINREIPKERQREINGATLVGYDDRGMAIYKFSKKN